MKQTIYGISKTRRGVLTVYGSDGVRSYNTTSTAKAVRDYFNDYRTQTMVIAGRERAAEVLKGVRI